MVALANMGSCPDIALPVGGPRVLPIRLAPVPGEAFDSWLERYAARLQVRLVDLIEAIGLVRPPRTTSHAATPPNWTTALQRAEVDRIVCTTGVDAGCSSA
jgi:hypothetical protein